MIESAGEFGLGCSASTGASPRPKKHAHLSPKVPPGTDGFFNSRISESWAIHLLQISPLLSRPSLNLGREGGWGVGREDCAVVSVEGVRLGFSQNSLPSLGLGPRLPLANWPDANTCHCTQEKWEF